ncbi:MAG: carbon-nitrogen hydrolase family protein [Kiritimatiellae bacterium]|nr:carbon-nitrogen hydrolase family protein [Kiritimatiellia bacterium]
MKPLSPPLAPRQPAEVAAPPSRGHGRRRLILAATVLLGLLLACVLLLRSSRPRPRAFVRFALCQFDSRVGDVRWSFFHALDYAQEAADHGAEVIILPEFSFTSVHDLTHGRAFFNILQHPGYASRLRDFTRKNQCFLLFNHPYRPADSPDSTGRFFNTSFLMNPQGQVVTNYCKRILAIMDKQLGMARGTQSVIAELPFARLGLMICKDSRNPAKFSRYRDADLVVIQFSHITRWGQTPLHDWEISDTHTNGLDRTETVTNTFAEITEECVAALQKPILLVNKTGLEDEFAYIGDSRIVLPGGTAIATAGSGGEILYADFPLGPDGRIDPTRPPSIPFPYANDR